MWTLYARFVCNSYSYGYGYRQGDGGSWEATMENVWYSNLGHTGSDTYVRGDA